jgi:hypothetical protein
VEKNYSMKERKEEKRTKENRQEEANKEIM